MQSNVYNFKTYEEIWDSSNAIIDSYSLTSFTTITAFLLLLFIRLISLKSGSPGYILAFSVAVSASLTALSSTLCRSSFLLFILNAFGNLEKCLIDVVACTSTSFKEHHTEFLSQSHALLCIYDFLICQICFISDKDFFNVRACMNLDLSHPVPHIIKAIFWGAIVGENDAHSSLVVSLCDGSETLLAGSVPDL